MTGFWHRTNWRIPLILALFCFALVGGLAIAAGGQPSSGSGNVDSLDIPGDGADTGCAQFADYWIDASTLGADPVWLERFSNCLRTDDGVWIVPTGIEDARLPAGLRLSEDEKAATAELRGQLLEQLSGLDDAADRVIDEQLSQLYSSAPQPVIGNVKEGVTVSSVRTRYARIASAYLMDPENEELAAYTGWAMSRRIDAYGRFRNACVGRDDLEYLHNACRGMEDALSIRYIPWPWDLANSVLLERYLGETVRAEQPMDDAEA